MNSIGNNGSQLAIEMHANDLLVNGMTLDQVEEIAVNYMINPKNLKESDFWADFLYTACDELGYDLAV